jgi:hypothetical protein
MTMTARTILDSSLARLRELLARDFGAEAQDFTEQAKAVVRRLPDDLAQTVAGLESEWAALREQAEPAPERLADFAFRCGQTYAKLATFRQIQMELENVVLGPESVSTAALQTAQIEPLARFVELRDRVFRKVADFTLKAILIGLGLLTVGLFLGLI